MKKILIALMVACAGFTYAQTPNIITIAGTGTGAYTGDNGPATAATLHFANEAAYDGRTGNIYITDGSNNCIRKVTPTGIITTVAGTGSAGMSGDGGPATAATMHQPMFMCVDTTGNLYFVDYQNSLIRKVSASGTISRFAGTGTIGFSGDGGPATAARVNMPYGIACDKRGNVFITDNLNNRIRKINAAGIISTIAGDGTAGFTGDGAAAVSARVNQPTYIFIDSIGDIFFSDGYYRVRKIDTNGIIRTVAGSGSYGFSGDGAAATTAAMRDQLGITMDRSGNLYIADNGNSRIRKVNPSGIISTYAGNGTRGSAGDGGAATACELGPVGGICMDRFNRLFLADGDNNKVRLITASCYGMPVTGVATVSPGGGTASTTFTATLTGASTDPGITFQWQKSTVATGPYNNIAGATNSTYASSGYTVTTFVRCLVSCVASTDSSVRDTIRIFPAGVTEVNHEAIIIVYPNPCKDFFHIRAQGEVNVDVFDILGRKVLHAENTDRVDVSGFAAGRYLVRISDRNGRSVKVAPMIKE